MKQEVLKFDNLRKELKTRKSHRTHAVTLENYKTVSEALKLNLIEEYRECKKTLGNSNQTRSGTSKLQHKMNVLKRVLLHEWKVTLGDP